MKSRFYYDQLLLLLLLYCHELSKLTNTLCVTKNTFNIRCINKNNVATLKKMQQKKTCDYPEEKKNTQVPVLWEIMQKCIPKSFNTTFLLLSS